MAREHFFVSLLLWAAPWAARAQAQACSTSNCKAPSFCHGGGSKGGQPGSRKCETITWKKVGLESGCRLVGT